MFLAIVVLRSGCALLPQSAAESESRPSADAICLLGISLWDTQPVLAWLQDGVLCVRTENGAACLERTQATLVSWSPDVRVPVLDEELVGGDAPTAATTPDVDGCGVPQPPSHRKDP